MARCSTIEICNLRELWKHSVMTKDELIEFWYGLVNSKQWFLWAIRPDLVAQKYDEGQIPMELVEGTKDRGCMVGWAP
jgi:hypothetical protein